jgi:hypothetical protein
MVASLILFAAVMAAGINVPQTCSDLAEGDIYTASFAGAHHFIALDPARPGAGALRYRQFSDWYVPDAPKPPALRPQVGSGASLWRHADTGHARCNRHDAALRMASRLHDPDACDCDRRGPRGRGRLSLSSKDPLT